VSGRNFFLIRRWVMRDRAYLCGDGIIFTHSFYRGQEERERDEVVVQKIRGLSVEEKKSFRTARACWRLSYFLRNSGVQAVEPAARELDSRAMGLFSALGLRGEELVQRIEDEHPLTLEDQQLIIWA
jgi:hypothetical protein